MRHISYNTNGVCSKQINFDLDENDCIYNIAFTGGCSGNLKAIALLLEGQNAKIAAKKLMGNICGTRNTSCGDQLAKAIMSVYSEK